MQVKDCVKFIFFAHFKSPVKAVESVFTPSECVIVLDNPLASIFVIDEGVHKVHITERDADTVEADCFDRGKVLLGHPVVFKHVNEFLCLFFTEAVVECEVDVKLSNILSSFSGAEPLLLHKPTAKVCAHKSHRISVWVKDAYAVRFDKSQRLGGVGGVVFWTASHKNTKGQNYDENC